MGLAVGVFLRTVELLSERPAQLEPLVTGCIWKALMTIIGPSFANMPNFRIQVPFHFPYEVYVS